MSMITEFDTDTARLAVWGRKPSPSLDEAMAIMVKYPTGTPHSNAIDLCLLRSESFLTLAMSTDNQDHIAALLERGRHFRFLALANPHTPKDVLEQSAEDGPTDAALWVALMSNESLSDEAAWILTRHSMQYKSLENHVEPVFDQMRIRGERILTHLYRQAIVSPIREVQCVFFGSLGLDPGIGLDNLAYYKGRASRHPIFRRFWAETALNDDLFLGGTSRGIHHLWSNPNLTEKQVARGVAGLLKHPETLSDRRPLILNPLVSAYDIALLKQAFPSDPDVHQVYRDRVADPSREGHVRDFVRETFGSMRRPNEIKEAYAKLHDLTQAETDFIKDRFASVVAGLGRPEWCRWVDPNDPTSGVVYAPKGSHPIIKDRRYLMFIRFDNNEPEYMTDLLPYVKGDPNIGQMHIPDGVIPPLDVILRSPFSDLLIDVYGINVLDLIGVD